MNTIGGWSGRVLIGAAVAALLGSAAACGSSSAGNSHLAAERQSDAAALVVDCAVLRDEGAVTGSIGRPSWVTDLGVQITRSNEPAFNSWYRAHKDATVAGRTLAGWQQATARSGKLPAAVCGASGINGTTSASDLQKQVFAKDPSAGNPWGS